MKLERYDPNRKVTLTWEPHPKLDNCQRLRVDGVEFYPDQIIAVVGEYKPKGCPTFYEWWVWNAGPDPKIVQSGYAVPSREEAQRQIMEAIQKLELLPGV